MKPRLLIPMMALIAHALLSDARGATAASFEWMRPIIGDVQTGRIFRVAIPPDVYAQCDSFPHDIRIFDDRNAQWPFFLQSRPPKLAHTVLSAESVNAAWVEGNERYFRIDLAVERQADALRTRHGRVSVHSTGQDYVRRVEIYGSDDQTAWGLLGKGYLVSVHDPRRIEENAVDYPESDFPHLQVRVYPNTRDARETFDIIRVLLQIERTEEIPTYRLHAQTIPTPSSDLVDEAQVLVLDLGYEHHPVEAVRLQASGGDYMRHVVIHTRDHADAPWRFGGAGDIHRIGSSVKDEIPVRREGRYIKCEIYHYDDAPLTLDVIEAHAIRDYLIIEAQSDRPSVLY